MKKRFRIAKQVLRSGGGYMFSLLSVDFMDKAAYMLILQLFQQAIRNPLVVNPAGFCETLNQFLKSCAACFHIKINGLCAGIPRQIAGFHGERVRS